MELIIDLTVWPIIGVYLAVGAHEFGHALCARIFGFQIREIRISAAAGH